MAGNEAMLKLGIDPSRWVACVYWKAPEYKYRDSHVIRTILDPAPYIEVIRHITEDLGGQVVRLGHPTKIEIPAFKGFFDLAMIENSEWMQLYAVSISRFFIGSGSGPTVYGSALGVPTAITDQNLCMGAWLAHDYILSQDILFEGKYLSQTDAYEAGILSLDWSPAEAGHYRRNTASQLVAATDEMYETTMSCTAWRTPHEWQPHLPRPNILSLPLPRRYVPELLTPPTQRSVKKTRWRPEGIGMS
jgi:putative glycosyltransferase (TIGR04372 family)